MSDIVETIMERKFKFVFRKRDLFWYAYGVVFGLLNGWFLVDAIIGGEVAEAIIFGLLLLFVLVVSVFLPYMEQQTNFYRQRHFDLTDALFDDLVAKANSAIVANKDLIVENEKLKGEVKTLTAKLAKKVG